MIYRDRVNTDIVEVERKLTWWQQTQMKGFWIVLAVLVLVCRKNIFSVAGGLFSNQR